VRTQSGTDVTENAYIPVNYIVKTFVFATKTLLVLFYKGVKRSIFKRKIKSGGLSMKLSKLLERLEYEVVQGSVETEVTTLANDSRKVESGSVFVCISGAVFDGHQYVSDVAKKGAAAIIAERDIEAPKGVTVIKAENTRYVLR